MTDLPARPAGLGRRAALAAVALLLSFATALVPLAPVLAATPPADPAHPAAQTAGRATFGIKPSHPTLKAPVDGRARFDYTATAGAEQPDYVALSNNALTTVTLSLYASDGFNTASDGFDLLPASKKPVDVGSWITLKTNVVTLKPHASVVVPFTVKVPARVTPGDHVGGIVASVRTYGIDKRGDRVAIDQRVGVRVYLRIQGPLDPRLTVSDLRAKYHGSWWNPFSTGKVTVSYTVHNPGNVRLGSTQALDVSGSYGAVHSVSVPSIDELVPDNTHSEQVVVHGVAPAFHERALLTLMPFSLPGDTDGRLGNVEATAHFWAVPWALLALVFLILLGGLVLLLRRRRQHRAARAEAAKDVVRTKTKVTP